MSHRPSPPLHRTRAGTAAALLAVLAVLGSTACEGDRGDPGPPGPPGPGPNAPHPGLVAEITGLSGASGADGSFQVGDRITVRFTIRDEDGNPLELDDLSRGNALVSGPTFNYQRVIGTQSDVRDRAARVGPGTYVYELPAPIPATYLAPINNSPSFPIGVMTGQPLLSGTYTLGLELALTTESGGETIRTPRSPTMDFRFGGAPTLEPRAVSSEANCNQCHGDLRFHGNNRQGLDNCLLCHHAGMESSSSPVPRTLDFKVFIHKLHTGEHLPSVLGVTTNPDGSRDYDAPPIPYEFADDYSHVGFPVWPSASAPMPRDAGYTMLTPEEQALEDSMRSGPVSCDTCHGDPDGAGPLPPPANGPLIYSQPTRLACGSCHDDWVWDRPYTSSMQTMPPQTDDATCILCHRVSGAPLDVVDAHVHPLVDPDLATGVVFDLQSVDEAGAHDGDGTIDPGEKVQLTFTIRDSAGTDIDPAGLIRFETVISGPTYNPNLVLFASVPTAILASGGTHVINAPEQVFLEFAGDSTAASGEVFTTARTPHLDVASAPTTVFSRTGTGAASTLAEDAAALQNWIDVAAGTGSMFARDDYIVLEDDVAGQEEYLRIQFVEGDRLWFSSPATRSYPPHVRVAHAAGSSVQVVTLVQRTETADYTIDAANGTITEIGNSFGTGAVVIDYTSDFIMPTHYAGTLNESPALGESEGGWVGKPVVDGTYSVGVWAARTFTVSPIGEVTSYTEAAPAAVRDFLVGDASTIVPNERIDSPQACYDCHDQLAFHGGGRRGYEGCILCHGLGSAEDRPDYVAANAPDNGVTIDFRTMLHKIHHGMELANASTYSVIGFGIGYPNNFSEHTYEDVGFPVQPGGTADCVSCHGPGNEAWIEPASRDHPTDQGMPVRVWRAVCNSCHDSRSATAHIESNTAPNGVESCGLCHGPGQAVGVEDTHRPR